MSTPDNRSVNFFSLFRRGQHYSKTWPLEERLGRSAWAGSCHCAVRLKFTHAGIVVAGQAFCNAITSCNPQLVL